MWLEINLLFLSVIASLVTQTFSALLWMAQSKSIADDYTDSRSASVHRGLLLSYSPAKKRELCKDTFTAQPYVADHFRADRSAIDGSDSDVSDNDLNDNDTDEEKNDNLENENKQQFSLIVKKTRIFLDQEEGGYPTFLHGIDVFVQCVEKDDDVDRKPFGYAEYISSAFRTGWWYASILDKDLYVDTMIMAHHISASPEYDKLEQRQLEEQYLNTREVIKSLQKESPEYVRLVEMKDDLLALSKWQKLHLCASILSSPSYRVDRVEYTKDWVISNKDDLEYKEKSLAFKGIAHEDLTTNCIVCRGADSINTSEGSTILFLSDSYDDKKSLYVSQKQNEQIYMSKYFRSVPVLMNTGDPIHEAHLFTNFIN